MTVLYQGRSMAKCPAGYTICNELLELTGKPNNTCMTQSECELAVEEARSKREGKSTENENETDIDQEMEEEELAKQKQKENIDNINDFLAMLEKGIIVDIETGRPKGMLDLNNLESAVDFFKSLGRLYSNETLEQTKLGGDLNQFLNIITSERASNRPELATGLTEKFLENIMGIKG